MEPRRGMQMSPKLLRKVQGKPSSPQRNLSVVSKSKKLTTIVDRERLRARASMIRKKVSNHSPTATASDQQNEGAITSKESEPDQKRLEWLASDQYEIASTSKESEPGGVDLTESPKNAVRMFYDFQIMVDDKSVVDQAYQMIASVPQFHNVLMDKEELINVILEKLPESWKDCAESLRRKHKERLSFEALITHLRKEEEERNAKRVQEKDDFWKYRPLYKAALRGDWARAEDFFAKNEGAHTAKINEYGETALHVAAGAGKSSKSIDFVKKLVNKMLPQELELKDQSECTPLHLAAWAGNKEAAEVLLKRQPSLIYIREGSKLSALDMAARNAKKDTLLYLLDATKDDPIHKLFPDDHSAAHFLILVITSGYYDIALDLVKKYPRSATTRTEDDDCGLKALARKICAFKSGSRHQWWERIIYALIPVKLDDDILMNEETTSHIRDRDVENAVVNQPQLPHQKYNRVLKYFCTSVFPVKVDDDFREVLLMNEETTSHIRDHDVENAVVNQPQVPHQKYNRVQLLVKYFCTFVPCIKNIEDQKEMHLQALKLLECLCERVISLNDSEAYNLHAKEALLTAAQLGIHEVMEEIVESFPNLLWAHDKDNLNLFQIAIKERHVNVFNLIYQMNDYQEILVQIKDGSGNNLLHLAGRLGLEKNNLVSGAALQMQREIQWFEEVKKFANPRDIDWRNDDDETPTMVFTKAHEKLRGKGEKWMKDTANSCTIPAALIVTVAFAAAITVPGGINDDGQAIFYRKLVFNIFVVFNAISLFASITSLSVSLSILTSRYAEHDFLFALPNRLIISLATLFLSITTMVVAFSCALYLMFGNMDKAWIVSPLVGLTIIPIFSFTFLQFPLLLDLMGSTYYSQIFRKQSDRPFY